MISSDCQSQNLKKQIGGPTDLNQAQNEVFRYFIEFGSYFFLEIA